MDGNKGDLSRLINYLAHRKWYRDHNRRLEIALAVNDYESRPDLDEIRLAAGIKFPGPIFEG